MVRIPDTKWAPRGASAGVLPQGYEAREYPGPPAREMRSVDGGDPEAVGPGELQADRVGAPVHGVHQHALVPAARGGALGRDLRARDGPVRLRVHPIRDHGATPTISGKGRVRPDLAHPQRPGDSRT